MPACHSLSGCMPTACNAENFPFLKIILQSQALAGMPGFPEGMKN